MSGRTKTPRTGQVVHHAKHDGNIIWEQPCLKHLLLLCELMYIQYIRAWKNRQPATATVYWPWRLGSRHFSRRQVMKWTFRSQKTRWHWKKGDSELCSPQTSCFCSKSELILARKRQKKEGPSWPIEPQAVNKSSSLVDAWKIWSVRTQLAGARCLSMLHLAVLVLWPFCQFQHISTQVPDTVKAHLSACGNSIGIYRVFFWHLASFAMRVACKPWKSQHVMLELIKQCQEGCQKLNTDHIWSFIYIYHINTALLEQIVS